MTQLIIQLNNLETALVSKLAELGEVNPEDVIYTALTTYLDAAVEAAEQRNEDLARRAAADAPTAEMAEDLGQQVYDPVLLALLEAQSGDN